MLTDAETRKIIQRMMSGIRFEGHTVEVAKR